MATHKRDFTEKMDSPSIAQKITIYRLVITGDCFLWISPKAPVFQNFFFLNLVLHCWEVWRLIFCVFFQEIRHGTMLSHDPLPPKDTVTSYTRPQRYAHETWCDFPFFWDCCPLWRRHHDGKLYPLIGFCGSGVVLVGEYPLDDTFPRSTLARELCLHDRVPAMNTFLRRRSGLSSRALHWV